MEGARSHSRVGRKTHAGSGGDGACMVLVKHDAVPGRVRLAVPRLYRSRKIKALLEHGLSRDVAIRRLAADIRTGTLLVEFDPALEHAEIAVRVEHLLTGKNSPLAARSADEDMSPASGEADWHIRDLEEIVALFESGRHGLTADEAALRLARFGPNEVPIAGPRSELAMLLDQFKNLPVALLGGSSLISLGTGSPLDALVTLGVIAANGGIGYAMETGAEKTIRDITGQGEHRVLVRRDGEVSDIPSREVVPGDILVLTPGAFIRADARLVEAIGLTVDESSLTGESLPVAK